MARVTDDVVTLRSFHRIVEEAMSFDGRNINNIISFVNDRLVKERKSLLTNETPCDQLKILRLQKSKE